MTTSDPTTAATPQDRPAATPAQATTGNPQVSPRTLHSTWAPSYPDRRPEASAAEIAAAAELLRGREVVAITGAGMSTDSGIPDYRGANAKPRSPMTYQQFIADPMFRRHYWARNHIGWGHMDRARPNAGHLALAGLERAGVVTGVITQNVDRLHQAAGSQHVLELHGSYADVICLACGHIESRKDLDARLAKLNPGFRETARAHGVEAAPDADAALEDTAHFRVAGCVRCGGMIKPHIVYFGENVPPVRVARSYEMVDDAGALLVAGTSLAVQSGLRLIKRAHRAGTPVLIVNRGLTRGDEFATARLNAGTSRALPALLDALAPAV